MLKLRIALALALAALIGLAVGALVWAKSYAPLAVTAYYGPGSGISRKPVMDDSGLLSLTFGGAGTRVAEIHFVVVNTGRWPITIERAVKGDIGCGWLGPGEVGTCVFPPELRQRPAKNGGGYALSTLRFRPLRVAAHAKADLWVRLRGVCHPDADPGSSTTSFGGIALDYRYLGRFERTQDVAWPFAVAFRC